MTGRAREHEVRLMGLGLAALALLAATLAIWVAAAVADHVRAPAQSGAAVTQGTRGPLGTGGGR